MKRPLLFPVSYAFFVAPVHVLRLVGYSAEKCMSLEGIIAVKLASSSKGGCLRSETCLVASSHGALRRCERRRALGAGC